MNAAASQSVVMGSQRARIVVTVATMAATLMQSLDNTIANVALPHMQGSLSASADQITWVLTAYIVAAAIFTAPVGWFTHRFGRKNFFIVTLVGFTATSALCGLAQTLPQMVFFRLAQGAFGAALVPLSQTTMIDLYPPDQRGQAMALWGMGVMVGPILGPSLGGVLTDLYNWRWVFYVNVPFGILATFGIIFFLANNSENRNIRFDWLGFIVLSLGLAAVQLMLDRGEGKDWFASPEIVAEALIAGLGIYLFIVHMLTAEKPFIPPQVFGDSNFVAGTTMMFGMGLVLISGAALLPPFLQNLAGLSVTQAGFLMAPRGIGTMVSMLIAGRLSQRVDARLLIGFGLFLLLTTLGQMAHWTPEISRSTILWMGVIQGFGMGFVFIPMQVMTFATLPAHLRTDATALYSLMRNLGGAMGVSIATAVLSRTARISHTDLVASFTPFNEALQSGMAGMMLNPNLSRGLTMLNAEATRQAQIIGYMDTYRAMLIMCVPAVLSLMLLRKPSRMPQASPREVSAME